VSGVDTIRLALPGRGYDTVIGYGLLDEAARWLGPLLPRRRAIAICDDTVARLHLSRLQNGLARAGIAVENVTLPPGEGSKDFAHLERVIDRLLDLQVARDDVVVALGGGVIGDLAGFAASILRRGIGIVQIPTTLLAQVDSAVGGKTGINTRHGKNLVGTIHQPVCVLVDLATLATLPLRQRRAGYAEIVKYGALGDAAFFAWLEDAGSRVIAGAPDLLQHAVTTSIRAKAGIVMADERETGERALLNLGHTFGHAFEAAAGYDGRLLHGEAVSAGMVAAFALSAALGLCPAGDVARLRTHLAAVGLPTDLAAVAGAGWSPEALLGHMAQDKKVKDGALRFVLARGIGRAFVSAAVPAAAVRAALAATLERAP